MVIVLHIACIQILIPLLRFFTDDTPVGIKPEKHETPMTNSTYRRPQILAFLSKRGKDKNLCNTC